LLIQIVNKKKVQATVTSMFPQQQLHCNKGMVFLRRPYRDILSSISKDKMHDADG
jgi:hypothetical protein